MKAASHLYDVAIIGAGFSGIGMAIALKRAGIDNFLLIERNDSIGGTWWENTYPGCACDVPSVVYSFSFALNPNWTRAYPGQAEIHAYLQTCCDTFDLGSHLRLKTTVTTARYDETQMEWNLTCGTEPIRARVLIGAIGPFSQPSFPTLPGMESFTGECFHTARWNHDIDVTGKRVGIIGTGASAAQCIPHLAAKVASLAVFQRTPPWILPKPDRPISRIERWLRRSVPGFARLERGFYYSIAESLAFGFTKYPRLLRLLERLAKRHLQKHIADPLLREALTPDYRLGCKRIIFASDYYPALAEPHVRLITDPIASLDSDGVLTENGLRVPLDILIFSTGFHVADNALPIEIVGRDGLTLSQAWEGGMEAYYGTSVAGFPNLFLLLGPNSGLGHNSVVLMAEAQIRYCIDALRTMRREGLCEIDLHPEAQAAFNAALARSLPRTVWQSGCNSWYLNARGRNVTIWPGFTFTFDYHLRRFHAGAYSKRVLP